MIFEVPQALAGERLDKIVAIMVGATRERVAAAIDGGQVTIDGVVVTKGSKRLAEGVQIECNVDFIVETAKLEGDPTVPFTVVYEDADVHTKTLVQGLLHRYPELIELAVGDRALRPGIVHRIDKGTSGLLMVARTRSATDKLIEQLSAHTVERRYLALAWGRFESRAGMIDAPIGRSDADPTKMTVSAAGRQSITHYEIVHSYEDPEPVTLVQCELETGRTHQIRVHLAAINHPVVGDPTYGGAKKSLPVGRPFLHAQTLGFEHPTSGEQLRFTSELPAELQAVLDRLS
jgi:23S rRNA pseudouridine1911/1915/1917 synthase